MKNKALYPGSFDPLTNGHVDLIRRGLSMFDQVAVGVLKNPSKRPLFSLKERVEMVKEAMGHNPRVRVLAFDGLLVDLVRDMGDPVVLRGLRVVSDFEYEFQMALMNRKMNPGYEVVFMMPDERYTYLSSSMVRQVALLGGSVRNFVPPLVAKRIEKKTKTKKPVHA